MLKFILRVNSSQKLGLLQNYFVKNFSMASSELQKPKCHYKLTYFDCKALGEPIRLVFVVAGVHFEDQRIPLQDYADVKNYGFGQVPVLIENGRSLTQSLTILRYLAKKFDLIPSDDFTIARCDEIVDFATELRLEFRTWIVELNEEKKESIKVKLVQKTFPKYYPILEELVGPGEFIAGNGILNLSWADLFLANWLEIWGDLILSSTFFNSFPALKRLHDAVFKIPVIQEYVRTRPKYHF